MRTTKHKINLSSEERKQLEYIVKNGKNAAKKIRRANILLLLDENNERKLQQKEVAEICCVSTNTVYEVSKQFVSQGLSATIERKKRETPPVPSKITGETEAKVIAISCSEPPKGRSRWTLQLIADKAVELGVFDSVSDDTIHKILKKHH